MAIIGIYTIRNKINDKIYVGESSDITKRWKIHKEDLNNNKHHSYKLQDDWNKYGEKNFKFDKILKFKYNTVFERLVHEDYYIKKYDSVENGYNCEYTVQKILDGSKTPEYAFVLTNTINIMNLNNMKYPTHIKDFIENNDKYFDYVFKTGKRKLTIDDLSEDAKELIELGVMSEEEILSTHGTRVSRFNYIIKKEYQEIQSKYILENGIDVDAIRGLKSIPDRESFKDYLISKGCIIKQYYESYKIKYNDFETHYMNWSRETELNIT